MTEPENTNVDMGGTEDRPPIKEPVENTAPVGDENEKMSVYGLPGDDDDLFGDKSHNDQDEFAPPSNANMLGGAQGDIDDNNQDPNQANQIEEQDQPMEDVQADVRETSPQIGRQDASAGNEDEEMGLDDEEGLDDEDIEEMMRETIGQETVEQTVEQADDLPAGPPSMTRATNHGEETEGRDDDIMNDTRFGSEELANYRPSEMPEQQNGADPMQDAQDDIDALPLRSQTGSGFGVHQAHIDDENDAHNEGSANALRRQTGSSFGAQQAHAGGEQPEEDALFVSDRATPAIPTPTTPTNTAPPLLRTAMVAGNSTYAKIRNMQKRLQDKKSAANKQRPRYNVDPDNEAYLEAVMSSITPSSSTSAPAVDEDEMADRQALAEFQRQARHYIELKRKNGGSLPFRQDVEWMKVKGAEDARRLKRARDLLKAQEDQEGEPDLFPDVHPEFGKDDEHGESSADEGFGNANSEASRKRRRRELPRKEPQQISMLEAELQSMLVGVEADEDMPKKKQKKGADDDSQQGASATGKGKRKASKPKPRASRSKAAPKSTAKGGRATAKNKREVDNAVRQATSLFTSNVFEQQAGADEADQPTFRARKKQDALKELIASVPIEDKRQARTDMSTLLAATKDFDGRGSVKAAGGNWLVKGMKTSLKGYQVLGSAFMRRRENSMDEPRGGLMADQMGLGKTLMMLANIVNGQPRKNTGQDRTTLLVASPALLGQWGKEIEQHTDCGLKVMKYGAGNRIDSNAAFEVLKHHDIILTSYSEVMKSYPKNEPPIECQTAEQKIDWWKKTYDSQRGVLHRMRFLRIVLDEAQAIKNYQGRTSIACRALMAQHKWALSGTPILNSLTELYPYFKFLGVPHTGSFKIFKHNYCDTNDAENTERLLVRLSQFMIRRTHADRMFNAPILKLPQADQGTFWCEFNPVERSVYDIVRQRFAKHINIAQAKGDLEKSYSNALVMLLRLRQLTAHILMLQFVMRDLLEVEDIEKIKVVVNEVAADSGTRHGRSIIAIRKQLEKHAIYEKEKAAKKAAAKAKGQEMEDAEDEFDYDVEDDKEPEEVDEPDQPTGQIGAGKGGSGKSFGKAYDFKPFLKSLKTGDSWEKAKKKARCSWCNKQPKNPYISDCGHLICEFPCLERSTTSAAEVGKDEAPCKVCGVTPQRYIPFEAEEEEFTDTVATGTRSKAGPRAAKKKVRLDRESISEGWLNSVGSDVLPSAKTMAIKAQILNWLKEDPKVKIIIYTQFLAMVKIMAKIFQGEGWQVEQYIGTMSLPAREKAISAFADSSEVNILLASLRCGGLGLNLTMASRVIMVDPWWNEASEQQAFCRVFRIGQKEETYMSRFCVKNSVDDRLMAMQIRKRKEIAEVMEDNGKTVKKMGIRDLMRLFGNLDEDAEGKPFILVDNPDPRGGFRADVDDEGYADEF